MASLENLTPDGCKVTHLICTLWPSRVGKVRFYENFGQTGSFGKHFNNTVLNKHVFYLATSKYLDAHDTKHVALYENARLQKLTLLIENHVINRKKC